MLAAKAYEEMTRKGVDKLQKSAEGIRKGAEELAGKGADTIKDYSGYAAAEEYRKAAEEYRKAAEDYRESAAVLLETIQLLKTQISDSVQQ